LKRIIELASNGAQTPKLALFFILGLLIITGCEDPGIVGNSFVGSGAQIASDTVKISDYNTADQIPTYSGNRSYLSAGKFDDPVFGTVTATGLLKPSISTSAIDTLQEDASMYLQLKIDPGNVYGDTTSSTTFDLVEMNQLWRGKSWKMDDPAPVSDNVVVSSTQIGMQDSVVIELPTSYMMKYRDFYYDDSANRDSLYKYNFYGLALVPKDGSNKILAINSSGSHFLFQNPDDTTYSQETLNDWAYSVERTNVPSGNNNEDNVFGDFSQVINFDFPIDKQSMGSQNLSRVELVLYQDEQTLTGTLPANTVRPPVSNAKLYLKTPEELQYSFDGSGASFSTDIDSTDFTYRFNLTNYINAVLFGGASSDTRFIGTIQSNNGIIYSTLLFNNEADKNFPKLLITSVNPETGTN